MVYNKVHVELLCYKIIIIKMNILLFNPMSLQF